MKARLPSRCAERLTRSDTVVMGDGDYLNACSKARVNDRAVVCRFIFERCCLLIAGQVLKGIDLKRAAIETRAVRFPQRGLDHFWPRLAFFAFLTYSPEHRSH